jgi:hypothetical protein
LIGFAWAICDTSTCLKCVMDPQCGWFGSNTSTGLADCRKNDSVPASLLSTFPRVSPCPQCQAGDCTACKNQTGCSWFVHSVPGVDGVCVTTASGTPPTPVGNYAPVSSCPLCKDSTSCTACYMLPAADNCAWFELAGVTGGKCAEASPGFAYTKKANGFCNGNPCVGVPTCSKCKGTLDANNNSNACAWYTSKVPSLYNSKCDQNATSNVVSTSAYDVLSGTCPACAYSSCSDCKLDTACKWVAIDAGILGTSFGQCVTTATSITGKTTIAQCPKSCEIHSCDACVAKTDCRWFISSAGQDPVCDRAADAPGHPFTTEYPGGGACPACSADRCYECASLTGCGWYKDTVAGFEVPFSGHCVSNANPGTNVKKIEKTDKKCEGNPNGAAAMMPALALVAFLGFSI